MVRILLVDDDTTFCLMLKTWLVKRGFDVTEAFSVDAALKALSAGQYDVALTDLRLPDKDGIFLLEKIKATYPKTQVILMTGYADIQTAVHAMKSGAFDYVAKPIIPDEILKKIQEALEQKSMPEGKKRRPESQDVPYIKGNSPESQKLFEYIRLVAPTMMTVLITGESGSGKEYIARLIHAQSSRKNAPFVAVDCGAIPKDLAASEFFGHVKGAFTGAVNDKTGYFVAASGGTIFLDEIGNLSYDVQVQLLRALEERKVKPVGSDKEVSFDVRIISATNENLKKAVAEGSFREDLYHRLNEFSLTALSLRDRPEDIPIFANHFLTTSNEELGKAVVGFDDAVMNIFKNYSWPGNLREMRNVVKRATLLCQHEFISPEDIPAELAAAPVVQTIQDLALRREKNEVDLIREALAKCNNNKSEAARMLKIDRKTLYNKMKLYSID
ncbi:MULTISPECIES: sigma-54-dependent transcriptional regulator [Culturomica]|jgi:two-component system response regulator HydG|uniref:sigma-54-dependent transcriptional regulator n=1 Tax=Culturomica TaxID=1926651 RepID=UPI0008399B2D|nr:MULTISPECIES: sigma-54 dependent transcriptional regulator [Odoribacteraceae]RHV90702.1 sigma-54-dependent Fis family transcriptional regulator [Odoribacter sp. OF09-27XD]HBO25610.1 sigma-54-dependent Fis family transcriptional regulator [Culturomica sp.]